MTYIHVVEARIEELGTWILWHRMLSIAKFENHSVVAEVDQELGQLMKIRRFDVGNTHERTASPENRDL